MSKDQKDWRLTGQETYLQGVKLVHRKYRFYPKNLDWDHDHCSFCWATFSMEDIPEAHHQGYTTEDDYHWVCEKCFEDFKDKFQWEVIDKL